jgi:hypothetical protein
MLIRNEKEQVSQIQIHGSSVYDFETLYEVVLPGTYPPNTELLVTSDFEVRNNTGMNVELVTQIVIADASNYTLVSQPNGSNFDRQLHYISRSRASLLKLQRTYTNPTVLLQVRAKSTDTETWLEVKPTNIVGKILRFLRLKKKVYKQPEVQYIDIMKGYGHLACKVLS